MDNAHQFIPSEIVACLRYIERSYTSKLPKMVPEVNLTSKRTKIEQKKQDRVQKRKIVQHITEGDTIQAYQRKRLAMSFETPSTPKRAKLHSPTEDNHSWSHEEATQLLLSHPAETKINWSLLARKLNIPGKNAGQVLKEFAIKQGFDTVAMEQKNSPMPGRSRRSIKKLPGGEISIPSLPPPSVISSEKKEMIATGKLSLGEPCSPHTVFRSTVTSDGEVKTDEVKIIGRKLSLLEIRRKLLQRHSKYMRLMTDQEIQQLTRDNIVQLLTLAHHSVSQNETLTELQYQLASLQRTRTLAFWHDHSTVPEQGYILFAVRVVYDTGDFLTEGELLARGSTRSIQEEVEQPVIHMIAPSTSAVSDQLALIPDRLECLAESYPKKSQMRMAQKLLTKQDSSVGINQHSNLSEEPRLEVHTSVGVVDARTTSCRTFHMPCSALQGHYRPYSL